MNASEPDEKSCEIAALKLLLEENNLKIEELLKENKAAIQK